MYVILVYDFGERRVAKMLKLCRKYLNWIQNSVFEGEISEVRLKEMLSAAKAFMKEDEDSIIVLKVPHNVLWRRKLSGKNGVVSTIFYNLVVDNCFIVFAIRLYVVDRSLTC